jgi:DNA uptake protein ComE-like DNA-binding protein
VLGTAPREGVELARRLLAAREQVNGFTSLEDLGTVLDMPGEKVEDLRDRVVFLPR